MRRVGVVGIGRPTEFMKHCTNRGKILMFQDNCFLTFLPSTQMLRVEFQRQRRGKDDPQRFVVSVTGEKQLLSIEKETATALVGEGIRVLT